MKVEDDPGTCSYCRVFKDAVCRIPMLDPKDDKSMYYPVLCESCRQAMMDLQEAAQ